MRSAFAALLLGLLTAHAERRVVNVPEWTPSPLYSHAIVSNGMVHVSGTIGVNMTSMELCPGGIKNETLCAFSNINRILDVAGVRMGLDNVLSCTAFVGNLAEDYDAMNEAYVTIFPKDPPARAAFGANGIAMGAKAEFSCVAEI